MNLRSVANIYKGFADPVRLRILNLLASGGPLRVGELAAMLGLPQSTVSRQLSMLRASALVQDQREGRFVQYSLGKGQMLGEGGLPATLAAASAACPELRRDVEKLKAKSSP